MTRNALTIRDDEIMAHLWDSRHASTVEIRKTGLSSYYFILTSPRGFSGIVHQEWDDTISGRMEFDGKRIRSSYRQSVTLSQLLTSIQIEFMMKSIGRHEHFDQQWAISGWGIAKASFFQTPHLMHSPMYRDAMSRMDAAMAEGIRRTGQIDSIGDISIEARSGLVKFESEAHGRVVLPRRYRKTRAAAEAVFDGDVAHAISTAGPCLPPPPVSPGNGRLTRLIELCHDALRDDPNLSSANGAPIRPLVETHLPDLLDRHQKAVSMADARDIPGIDADLESGISIVTRAIEEALLRHSGERRLALAEQIAFLSSRHPEDNMSLPSPHRHRG